MNTVVGNVARTHHPCGVCRALVIHCQHWQPAAMRPNSRRSRTAAGAAASRDLIRQLGLGR